MTQPVDEEADLDLVSRYLASNELTTERFSKAEMAGRRTPDFKVLKDGEVVAYCEVKSPHDPWLDSLLDEAPAGTIVGGERADPVFNRLARHLKSADEQLAVVNPDREKFNIVAYVNHDDMTGIEDLREAIAGDFLGVSGRRVRTQPHLAEVVLKSAKERVDGILWFEPSATMVPAAILNEGDPDRLRRFCDLFGFDPSEIQV